MGVTSEDSRCCVCGSITLNQQEHKEVYVLTVSNKGHFWNGFRHESLEEVKEVLAHWQAAYRQYAHRFKDATYTIEKEITTRKPLETGQILN